jgi:hypothetical protein
MYFILNTVIKIKKYFLSLAMQKRASESDAENAWC